MQETQVRPLGWEDPLEKGMATRSSILAWEIPWTEQPDSLQSIGLQELDTIEQLDHRHAEFCGTLSSVDPCGYHCTLDLPRF